MGAIIITIDNAITYKAQRDKNARELKLANAAITDMQIAVSVMLLRSMQNTRRSSADRKAENDALRDDDVMVVVGCTSKRCQSVREATTSGVDNTASPDRKTPLNGIISPSERS